MYRQRRRRRGPSPGLLLLILLTSSVLGLWMALRPPALDVPSQGFELRDVTLVEPGSVRHTGQSLRVEGGRITRIRSTPPEEDMGPYGGAFVLPGLIDLHVHHPPSLAIGERALFSLLFLAHGVTSVRDTGSMLTSLVGHRRRIEAGEVAGPRIFACGPFLDGDPPSWPGAVVISDAVTDAKAERDLRSSGPDCIKVYNGLSAEEMDTLRRAAAGYDLPIVAHVPDEVPIAEIGRVEVQHLMGLADDWRAIDPTHRAAYIRASKAQGLSHTPTLVTFVRSAQLARYDALRTDPVARLLPDYYRDMLWNPKTNRFAFELSPASGNGAQERVPAMKAMVADLHANGVRILAGTDTMNPFVVPGASLQEELGHLVDAGLSSEEAWLAATRWAGEALGVPGLGTLREGAPADFLIFRRDPSLDLAALATLEAVVAQGRLYPKPVLDRALDRQRAHFASPLYQRLSTLFARLALRWVGGEVN